MYLTKITNHALLIIRGTVVSAEGVENATGSHEALGKVAEDVDVKTVLSLCRNGVCVRLDIQAYNHSFHLRE